MDTSPYLFAIQALAGETPGDKYKELHTIAAQIINSDEERAEFLKTGHTERVPPALLPHLRILVGNKVNHNDAVIEALQSDDIIVIKLALGARWFFHSKNAHLNVEFFANKIVPYISVRTRLELIKVLTQCLTKETKKAEEFFDYFFNEYGLEQASPLLLACGEDYVYEKVLKHKISFPPRILYIFYRKSPRLVIRYLQLGNNSNEQNKEDRKIHSISLSEYASFLPILIKNNIQEFLEFYENIHTRVSIQIGNTRAGYFLKNATDVLIKKPKIFLQLLPMKLVNNKLTVQQFETMIQNYFSDNQFTVENLFSYLSHYPQEKKLNFMKYIYKSVYKKELLDEEQIFEIPEFFQSLPSDVQEKLAKNSIKPQEGSDEYYALVYRLPPKLSIPILKDRINKPSVNPRSHWIIYMLNSCSLYGDKVALLDVLYYYNQRHKNELTTVLNQVLDQIFFKFDVKTFGENHWKELRNILQRAHVKDELRALNKLIYKRLIGGALDFYLKKCKDADANLEDKNILQNLLNVLIEQYFEKDLKFNFIPNNSESKWDYLQLLLVVVSTKYPESHKVWSTCNNKMSFTSYIIKLLSDINDSAELKKKYANEIKQTILNIKNDTWLIKFIRYLLVENVPKKREKNIFRQSLYDYDRQLYQELIDENPDLINDVKTSDATALLKQNFVKILDKWEQYLRACRKNLHLRCKATRTFVAATKWYKDLPIKFVNQCLLEIEEDGSTLILGILLEGEVLGKIFEPYLPQDKKLDVEDENAKESYKITSSLPKAMNFANPPVALKVILALCKGDFVQLATQTMRSTGQRIPANEVLNFGKSLVDNPISVKKLGIRLVLQVASKNETQQFLNYIWEQEKNLSIREIVAKMIFDFFLQQPSNESWELMKLCMTSVTATEMPILTSLSSIKNVDMKYVAVYTDAFVKHVETLPESEMMNESSKKNLIVDLVDGITSRQLCVFPEDLLTYIIKKYFFAYSTNFTINLYLFLDETKIEQRLDIITEILKEEIKLFDKPDVSQVKPYYYYPANRQIRDFFRSIVQAFHRKPSKSLSLLLVDRLLSLFLTNVLQPVQEPNSFITLVTLKAVVENEGYREFGKKFAVEIRNIVEVLGSELFLNDIIDVMQYLLIYNNIYSEDDNQKLYTSLIYGLAEADIFAADLIAIKLLKFVQNYEREVCKDLIDKWKKSGHPAIQAALSNIINDRY